MIFNKKWYSSEFFLDSELVTTLIVIKTTIYLQYQLHTGRKKQQKGSYLGSGLIILEMTIGIINGLLYLLHMASRSSRKVYIRFWTVHLGNDNQDH
jgi:hypothetical protein